MEVERVPAYEKYKVEYPHLLFKVDIYLYIKGVVERVQACFPRKGGASKCRGEECFIV